MKIAIIGSGMVGGSLGKRLAANHEVTWGVRHAGTDEMKKLIAETGNRAKAASVADAVKVAGVVILATPWPATQDAIKSAGELSGKIVLDCTNPLKADMSGLEIGHTTSAGEQVAEWAKGAKVIKIFNTTGFPNMLDPNYGSDRVAMLYCGDDAVAKKVAVQLASDIGFEPVDAGPLTQARQLEAVAMLWISMAFAQNWGTGFAWKLLRR